MSTSVGNSPRQETTHTPVGLIAFARALVGAPLAYGLYQTIKTASQLF